MESKTNSLKYGLEDRIPARELGVYTLQHIIYFAAGTVVLPIAVGMYLGLDQGQIAEFLQRTFFLCGVTSLLQVKLGHTYPIIDGPAGLWASMLIVMAVSASSVGTGLDTLRTDLQTGFMAAGAVVILLAVTGAINFISKIFTPVVNGVIITLMVLQMSETFIKGILGISDTQNGADLKSMAVFFITVAVILFVAVYLKGFIQSIATLVGVVVGWILALLLGLSVDRPSGTGIISIPDIWAWGRTSFDLGVTVTCVIGALVLLSMSFVKITATTVIGTIPP